MNLKLIGAATMALAVAACGASEPGRTTGGAATGAATGAGVGALAGPVGALAGAAVGAGAGAATGAVTSPETVNLGEPLWEDPQVRVPGTETGRTGTSGQRYAGGSGQYSRSEVREVQRELNNRGYQAGPADGIMGPRTSQALREFQRTQGMEATGRIDSRVASALNLRGGGDQAGTGGDPNRAYMGGGMVGTGSGTGMQPGMSGGMDAQDRMGTGTGMQPGTSGGMGGTQDRIGTGAGTGMPPASRGMDSTQPMGTPPAGTQGGQIR